MPFRSADDLVKPVAFWTAPAGHRLLRDRAALMFALLFVAVTLTAPAKDFLVFFGTYTGTLSKGIYVSKLDSATGSLSAPELAAETPSPCFLATSSHGNYLYAANNNLILNGQKTSGVSAFTVDNTTGHLTLLNQKSSGGPGVCHVSIDDTDHILLAANYSDGSVKSFQLNADGSLGADGSYIRHHGSSVNTNRQSAAHAHFIVPDSSHRFALACDLGMDRVIIYKIDPATGTLSENASAPVPPGSGARHLVFSPDGKFVHVINEMGCTITTFSWNSKKGELKIVETISALPPGVALRPDFTAAEILACGNFIYATIRGHDSISVFSANPHTGHLAFVQNISSGGKVPRGLGIDPTGRWLFAGNQNSDNAVEFEIDSNSGKISPAGRELKIGSPVDVKFIEIR